ncbi:ketopantoate reductase PanE/ApbA [Schizosaccharomyces cryophilus OY26]|uniref:2-dehydropantoate 2-reductase n=1 Tax=Schizosaccharomyces cryophilus (strain OY26 / ATCC MYA-4695 / CBS 11777 / NBRC 106824 / NRRL Y48691) TaxID=653667 RepID=S9X1R0_SCHCR|nr:ketopantoate reductase PanE/ApbA [Schizosaccharomyces cryophilus OY26]EPY51042.1 ketopantoate reductase PanE/ApbA [Schizosaccharomyces cryophilus OY26]
MDDAIYILGAGSIGNFLACELANLSCYEHNVVLLLRNKDRLDQFRRNGSYLILERTLDDKKVVIRRKFKATCLSELNVDTIDNLIVTTKTTQTEAALRDYLPLLKRDSNILFVHNGFGVIETLVKTVWRNANVRPNLYQGVTSHSVLPKQDFYYCHSCFGVMKIAKVSRMDGDLSVDVPTEPCAMVEALLQSKMLNGTYLTYDDLLIYQCQKFMVNACMNSTTTIIDCINYELSNIAEVRTLFQSIITECVDVLFKTNQFLADNGKAREVLNVPKLVDLILYLGFVENAKNSTSMRIDTLAKRETEIDSLNGWIVKLAKEIGYRATVNETVTLLVKARTKVNQRRA